MSNYTFSLKNRTGASIARNKIVFAGVRAGIDPLEIAHNAKMSRSQVYKHISALGYVPCYLSLAERVAVRHMRNNDNLTYEQHTGNA